MTTNVPTRTVEVAQTRGVEKVNRPIPAVVIPGLGNVVSTFVFAGSSGTNQLNLLITGFQLTTPEPATICLQPRQGDNREFGFPDEFAVIVVETHADSILVHIKRLDDGGGWGQNLRLDILIFDQVNNP